MDTSETGFRQPTIVDAQMAVRGFLEQSLPEVHRVNVVKVSKTGAEDGGWEAEAEVWQPNPTIRALHLETQRPVLDQQHYLVRLDGLLNVLAYELEEGLRHDG